MLWIQQSRELLSGSPVSVEYLEGLDHEHELTETVQSLPVMLAFTRKHGTE
jgi:hypothetical protein